MTLRQRALIGPFIVASIAAAASSCGRRVDVAAVRAALAPDSREAFDLAVVLQRLDGGGETDWARAEQICRGLKWPRCDRPALEEMQRRSQLPGAVKRDPAAAAALAVADLTWAFGSEDAARKMFRSELDRIPEADGPRRARVFVRFGVIDGNFDGQAALFAQACVADPNVCDVERLKLAAQREVQARFVPPGNVVPLYFGGHPKIPGHE
jgi:hypothetical protein